MFPFDDVIMVLMRLQYLLLLDSCDLWTHITQVPRLALGQSQYITMTYVTMGAMGSQITGISIVYSTVCSGAHQRKHHSPRHWPLLGESIGGRWVPLTKEQ